MTSNRLQLNPAKTEVLWCASARRQHQIPSGPVRIGNTTVLPVTAVRHLGVYLNADVSVAAHVTVTATVRTCFVALRQIRSVRRLLSVFSARRSKHVTPLLCDLFWQFRLGPL